MEIMLNFAVSLSLLVSMVQPVCAEGKDHMLNVEKKSDVTTLYSSNGVYAFEIIEGEKEFILIFDMNQQAIYQGKRKYKLNDYCEQLFKKTKQSVTEILDKIAYEPMDSEYYFAKNDLIKEPPLPTTGYGSYSYTGIYKRIDVEISLTTATVTFIAAFIFGGSAILAKGFVQNALTDAAKAGVIAFGVDVMNGDVYYECYQAMNTIDPRACREKRVPFVDVQGNEFYGEAYVFDYWATKPW